MTSMIKVYVDAATKGNPGPSGGGFVLLTEKKQVQKSFPLQNLTNHQAEFAALSYLLDYLHEQKQTHTTIIIYTDSKVVSQAIEKNYSKNPDFIPYLQEIKEKISHFTLLIIQWIPESKNKGADNLAKQGLQKALKL